MEMQAIPQPRIFHVRVAQISQKVRRMRQSQFDLKLIDRAQVKLHPYYAYLKLS